MGLWLRSNMAMILIVKAASNLNATGRRVAAAEKDESQRAARPALSPEFGYCFSTKTCCSLLSAINNTLPKPVSQKKKKSMGRDTFLPSSETS